MKRMFVCSVALLLSSGLAIERGLTARVSPSADGNPALATMTVKNGEQLLWTATTPGLSCVTESQFSPDGRYLLNTADGCGYIQLWDVKTGQRLRTFRSHTYRLNFAAFTPDSKRLLLNFTNDWPYGYDHPEVPLSTLWDLASLRKIAVMSVPKRASWFDSFVHFSADGRRMIFTTWGWWGPASVFDASTGQHLQTFPRLLKTAPEREGGVGAQDARLSDDGLRALVRYNDGRFAEYTVQDARLLRIWTPTDTEAKRELDRFGRGPSQQ